MRTIEDLYPGMGKLTIRSAQFELTTAWVHLAASNEKVSVDESMGLPRGRRFEAIRRELAVRQAPDAMQVSVEDWAQRSTASFAERDRLVHSTLSAQFEEGEIVPRWRHWRTGRTEQLPTDAEIDSVIEQLGDLESEAFKLFGRIADYLRTTEVM